jgi:beta-glucosidase
MFKFNCKLTRLFSWLLLLLLPVSTIIAQHVLPFRNTSLPVHARVADLLSRLTPDEKISLFGYRSQSVDRLGIPAYKWCG